MELFETVEALRRFVAKEKASNKSIGLVPTMGSLHEGHASLVRRSIEENDVTIVSIFVNPKQFGPNEDFDKYPRTLKEDMELLRKLGATAIFHPDIDGIYVRDDFTEITNTILSEKLCGITRPTHFKGVLKIVAKLFNIAEPTRAYFGMKDFQQYVIIKHMVEDLNFNIELVPCPIVREESGLALSSRNRYLSIEERERALALNKALKAAEELINNGERSAFEVIKVLYSILSETEGLRIDYIKIVDGWTLEDTVQISTNTLIALACYVGNVRLIDNLYIEKVEIL